MQTEYVIWGIAPGTRDEQVLIAFPNGKPITNRHFAERCLQIAVSKGATACRIQTIDGSVPNFTAAITTR